MSADGKPMTVFVSYSWDSTEHQRWVIKLRLSVGTKVIGPSNGPPQKERVHIIARILKAGRKVAICDQVEEARPGQLVRREVTQILSPGTHFDDRMRTGADA